jgi:hypothetical protein
VSRRGGRAARLALAARARAGRALFGGTLVGALLAAGPLAAAPAAAGEPTPPALRAADRALVARVLADGGVDRRLPGADLRGYLTHLGGELGRRLTAWVAAAVGAVTGSAVAVAAAVLIAVALAALLWALTRWILHRWRRRGADGRPPPAPAAVASGTPGRGDPALWRAELERRLAEGRLAEALEAAWWWLALSLAGERADPSWTSRELLERAVGAGEVRRRLAPLLAGFDVLAYGPRRPTVAAVRGLVAALEGELA